MNMEYISQIQYMYEHYSLELEIAQKQFASLQKVLDSLNKPEISEPTKEQTEKPIKMNLNIINTKIEFCQAAKILMFEKITQRRAFSYEDFEKIKIQISLN